MGAHCLELQVRSPLWSRPKLHPSYCPICSSSYLSSVKSNQPQLFPDLDFAEMTECDVQSLDSGSRWLGEGDRQGRCHCFDAVRIFISHTKAI